MKKPWEEITDQAVELAKAGKIYWPLKLLDILEAAAEELFSDPSRGAVGVITIEDGFIHSLIRPLKDGSIKLFEDDKPVFTNVIAYAKAMTALDACLAEGKTLTRDNGWFLYKGAIVCQIPDGEELYYAVLTTSGDTEEVDHRVSMIGYEALVKIHEAVGAQISIRQ